MERFSNYPRFEIPGKIIGTEPTNKRVPFHVLIPELLQLGFEQQIHNGIVTYDKKFGNGFILMYNPIDPENVWVLKYQDKSIPAIIESKADIHRYISVFYFLDRYNLKSQ